ncbi:MAG: hypothetical protein ACTHYN_08560 [Marinobacter sp.]|uniref:hypothetical protein n=1 Tax=Marinobacter sp. TaxID=50741 RepID=UPI003F9971B0
MFKRLLPLIILAASVLGFLLLKMTRPEPAQVSATERSWRVQIQDVEPGTHTPVLPLYGEVVSAKGERRLLVSGKVRFADFPGLVWRTGALPCRVYWRQLPRRGNS